MNILGYPLLPSFITVEVLYNKKHKKHVAHDQ